MNAAPSLPIPGADTPPPYSVKRGRHDAITTRDFMNTEQSQICSSWDTICCSCTWLTRSATFLLSIGLLPKQFIFLRQGLFFLQEFLNHSGLERCSITVFSSCLQYILFQPLSVFIIVPETTKKPEQAMLCMARSSYVILLKKNYGHEGERVSKAHHWEHLVSRRQSW